ncbi:MAG: ABC transporter substrate-binding protein [Hyphomicrobiales bacterium]
MIKRCIMAGLAATMLAFNAHAEPVAGGTANVLLQPEPPGLMLGIVQNAPAQMVGGNIYEGLLRYGKDMEPMPQLATSWEVSEDGTIYTFHLRDDVTWHDGKPFKADDVVFSADVFLRETHSRFRTVLKRVEKIEAVDDYTVRFILKEPFDPFLKVFEPLTMPMVPRHIYEGTDFFKNPANNHPIGTGPFKFAEWVKGSYVHLAKHENYYEEGKPYLDNIYWHVVPDAASRTVAYENGTVDILPGGSVENFDIQRLASLENSCITQDGWELLAPMSFLWLNNREAPLDDKRFRQAVMYALDRKFAHEVLWNGFGKIPTGPVISSSRLYTDDVTNYEHNPEKARKLLEEMGYDGKPIRLMPLPYGETWQRWAEAVRQNLEEVGIRVELEPTDVAGWNQKISEWDYDMAFTFMNQYADPALGTERLYVTEQIFKGSAFNNAEGYSNEEVDRLFAEGASAFPAEKRTAIYTELQKKLNEDVPVAWLLELSFPTIYRCNVKDLVTTSIGLSDGFKDAWIEPRK